MKIWSAMIVLNKTESSQISQQMLPKKTYPKT